MSQAPYPTRATLRKNRLLETGGTGEEPSPNPVPATSTTGTAGPVVRDSASLKRMHGKAIGMANSKQAKKAKATGQQWYKYLQDTHIAGRTEARAQAGVEESISQIDSLDGRVAVVTGIIPRDICASSRDAWSRKQMQTIISFPEVSPKCVQDDVRAKSRKQFPIPEDDAIAERMTSQLAALRVHLGVHTIARVGLQSKAHSNQKRSWRQIGHFDFSQHTYHRWSLKQAAKKQKCHLPWTCLLSLQAGGKLRIHTEKGWVRVNLNTGDVVVFRGDVYHAGDGYVDEHWRVHEYWIPHGSESLHWREAQDPTTKERYVSIHDTERHAEHGGTWDHKSAEVNGDCMWVYTGNRYANVDALIADCRLGWKAPYIAG